MRNKMWIIVCVVILIIGVLLFLCRDKILGKKDSGEVSGSTQQVPEFPLCSGSRGEKVKALQRYLNSVLQEEPGEHNLLAVDGIFGPKTAEACGIAFGVASCSEDNYKAYVEPYNG